MYRFPTKQRKFILQGNRILCRRGGGSIIDARVCTAYVRCLLT
jgi:hypothetical protein